MIKAVSTAVKPSNKLSYDFPINGKSKCLSDADSSLEASLGLSACCPDLCVLKKDH